MKTSEFISISWAVLALCCSGAQAQDSNHDLGSVDVSVHAGVEAPSQDPQPSQDATKRPTTFSSWSSQTAKQNPARGKPSTLGNFQPARQTGGTVWPSPATLFALDQATDGASGKPRGRPNSFGILPLQRVHGSSTPLALSVPISPSSALPNVQGFSRPFEQKQSGQTFTPLQTNFSHGKAIMTKRFKTRSPESVGRLNTGDSPESATSGKR